MLYYFYELHPIITTHGLVFKNPDEEPKIVYTLEVPDNMIFFDYMKEYLYDKLIYEDNFCKSFELDEKYYVVPSEGYYCYVFEMHKGYCFYDCAEYDERVVIAVELELNSDKMYI